MPDELLTQRIFKEITETEKAEKKAKFRWLTPGSSIYTTKKIAADAKIKAPLDEKPLIIYRNIKLDLFLWLTVTCIFLIPVSYIIIREIKSANANILGIVFLCFLFLLFPYVGYKNLTLKRLNSPIKFTTKSITINDEIFNWSDIQDTFFVYRFSHMMMNGLFVIGFKSGEIRYFNIGNQLGFGYNERDFSRFVEHYKHSVSTDDHEPDRTVEMPK